MCFRFYIIILSKNHNNSTQYLPNQNEIKLEIKQTHIHLQFIIDIKNCSYIQNAFFYSS